MVVNSYSISINNFFLYYSVLNCARLLTRVLPYIFEDPEWRGFFWTSLPENSQSSDSGESVALAHSLLNAISVRV